MFEMIVGHGPFGSRKRPLGEVLTLVQSSEPVPLLSEFVPNAPPKLVKLLAWMLEKDVA
jgi:hypothetical protein